MCDRGLEGAQSPGYLIRYTAVSLTKMISKHVSDPLAKFSLSLSMSKHADHRFHKHKRPAVNYASLSKIMYTTSAAFKMEAMSS